MSQPGHTLARRIGLTGSLDPSELKEEIHRSDLDWIDVKIVMGNWDVQAVDFFFLAKIIISR